MQVPCYVTSVTEFAKAGILVSESHWCEHYHTRSFFALCFSFFSFYSGFNLPLLLGTGLFFLPGVRCAAMLVYPENKINYANAPTI